MTRECSHILPTGRKCRAAATRNQPLCRHHAPKPAVAGPPPLPKRDRYSRIARWTNLSRNLPWLAAAEIPSEIFTILYSLLQDDISDREAGRLLRGLLLRLGSVPFPIPDPDAAAPQPEQPRLPPSTPSAPFSDSRTLDPGVYDPALLDSLLQSLGQRFPEFESVRSSLHQTQPPLTQPQPSLTHTRPSPHQTRPTMNQTQPSYK
ncbi:MAG: hypothetical protein WA891_20855 [Acidobacteriaceae bacterium]